MADFQQPNFFPGVEYNQINIPQTAASLDAIFNSQIRKQLADKQSALMQADLQSKQLQMQNEQAQQNLQYAPFGFTTQDIAQNPQAIQQAIQPQPMQPGVGQGQGAWANPGQPVQEHPIVQHIRDYIQAQRAATVMGIQAKQAEMYKNIQQGREAGFYPDLMQPGGQGGPQMPQGGGMLIPSQMQGGAPGAPQGQQPGNGAAPFPTGNPGGTSNVQQGGTPQGQVGGGIVPNFVDQEAMNVISGKKAPSMVKGRGVDPKLSAAITARINSLAPGFDWENAENQFQAKGEKATSTAKVQGGNTQTIGSLAGTLEDVLNRAEPLVGRLNT